MCLTEAEIPFLEIAREISYMISRNASTRHRVDMGRLQNKK